ncbi:hypothetical protein BZA05DRAFT_442063 [Tricharina praecox]|uniref:uncharacterized protein n=1 Tax=Tricharina praecox TaxID=43433 RepID=UPI0022200EE6|nr:uncharacterized protein BZA05DRAFT_442063 [Tricharina praecox]KAI5856368.1 hypothetical protein BZA05DRAFT_442063 [Tricharina praecox]
MADLIMETVKYHDGGYEKEDMEILEASQLRTTDWRNAYIMSSVVDVRDILSAEEYEEYTDIA